MKHFALTAALPLSLGLTLGLSIPAAAQEVEPVTPASVVASAEPADWLAIAPDDLLVMELAPNADGAQRQVVIQLMPAPFSQPWVENVRALAQAHWWDGTSVYRVVDNWVAQWGDVTEAKALPEGVVAPVERYESEISDRGRDEFRRVRFFRSGPYGASSFSSGWPIGYDDFSITPIRNAETGETIDANATKPAWPIHCYGSVGVARDLAPDTGTGSELYAVIGHAPRQLDRNIAVVGRVIEGIEHLSTLRRGTGDAGVYEDRAEDTPIVSVRLASEMANSGGLAFEYLDTSSETFARYVAVRANRQDEFYAVPAGGVDICNVQVPIRRVVAD